MYIVKLVKDAWIAYTDGDAGSTLVEKNAQRFDSYRTAFYALEVARCYGLFENAEIVKDIPSTHGEKEE